jgi:hypothetical protein
MTTEYIPGLVPSAADRYYNEIIAKLQTRTNELSSSELRVSAHEYAMDYEFRADEGDYVPTDGERSMIEDAINGFLGENNISASPSAEIEALRTESKTRDENNVGIGMAIAAAIIMRVWGHDVEAREIISAAGLTSEARLREIGVEDYDLDALRPILDETHAALSGEEA